MPITAMDALRPSLATASARPTAPSTACSTAVHTLDNAPHTAETSMNPNRSAHATRTSSSRRNDRAAATALPR